MTLVIESEPVPLKIDDRGGLRVGGTRVTFDSVIAAFRTGATAEAIVDRFPSLDLSDVYAVLAWYLHHREQADEYLREREIEAEQLRQQVELQSPPNGLRERLLGRRKSG